MNASIAIEKIQNRRIGPFSLKLLFSSFPERIARKGETLTKQQHSLAYIYYLVDGLVKDINYYPTKGKEVVNDYHTAGDLMNLDAYFKQPSKDATLRVASSKAIYKIIPVNQFKELIWQNQGLNQLILSTLSEKVRKNKDRLHRLLVFKSRQRVVQFLIDYVAEVGQRVGYEYVVKRPFTHEEMGYLSDTSRQTVTTVLNELKVANILHFTRRYIIIRDMEGLVSEVHKE